MLKKNHGLLLVLNLAHIVKVINLWYDKAVFMLGVIT